MEPVGIILLVLFLFLLILGPITCVRLSSRNAREKVHNPQPDQLDTARRKLSTVTTLTVLPQTNSDPTADIEAPAPLSEFGECPICIGPLVPEPAHALNNEPRPTLEEISTVTSHQSANHEAKAGHQETAIQTTEDHKDDILTINACGHSFHSRCLSSWFLIERHDCPVCRVQFYKGTQRRESTLHVSPFW
jgi:hypothetical protein